MNEDQAEDIGRRTLSGWAFFFIFALAAIAVAFYDGFQEPE
jgi:hypothetical protein